MNLKIEQMDAVTVFLQGSLSEEIYMEQPALYVDQNNKSKSCHLNKSLYGLKQSSIIWNDQLNNELESYVLLNQNTIIVYYTKLRIEIF